VRVGAADPFTGLGEQADVDAQGLVPPE
jgi:hypothetical protein